ncbi:ABC transporter substrate-binding protein [Solihabitans fulvus]|uniref:ABC transporter substrate-binding protein n=1 Tax=Solihabitans fulvus TaxID=1892852 RepID=A0A5B2XEW8_9PSEU|nr:ABC transporter substrate-binding protein [Solihabitans fulvus]KAA2261796.1 ABC transporter substrate-binding protein [Solihabitans fulvus]
MEKFPWWQAHAKLALTAAVGLLLVVGGGLYRFWPHDEPTYVTDGSYVFNESLRAVEGLIRTENQRVADSHLDYVRVVFTDPMSPVPGVDPNTHESVRRDVEGAYLAQLAWNRPNGKPPVPQIQLFLADEGSQLGAWQATAAAIVHTDRVVAVAGLGVSVDNARSLVAELARHKIAIVAGAITGDHMTLSKDEPGPVPGMVRVAPTNSDEAAATLYYLDRDPEVPDNATVVVVQDQNNNDDFAATLGSAFVQTLEADKTRGHTIAQPGMVYDSRLTASGTILAAAANRVCDQHADVVYFAGRGNALQGFLGGLASRSCASARHLTVVGATDLLRQAGETMWRSGQSANMTVISPAITNPDMWSRDANAASAETSARFTAHCGTCFPTLFPGESLADGDAVLSHDSVWTAAIAIRQVVEAGVAAPTPGAVAQSLNELKVDAASGWICAFDANHNPVNKAIPIVKIDQDGKVSYLSLSSPKGVPPSGGCPQ